LHERTTLSELQRKSIKLGMGSAAPTNGKRVLPQEQRGEIKMTGSLIPLERMCLESAQRVLQNIRPEGSKRLKENFKLVNSLLQVLDREGFYAATTYLAAYGKGDTGICLLTQFNSFVREMKFCLGHELPEKVTPSNLHTVRRIYGKHFSSEETVADISFMFFRRMLIHLRHELKAEIKN